LGGGRVYGSSAETVLALIKATVRRHGAPISHRKRRSQPQERPRSANPETKDC
jgi:hypothetical protein